MAIKISNSTIIDDSRNVGVVGILTATTFNVGTGGTVITANTTTGNSGIGTSPSSSRWESNLSSSTLIVGGGIKIGGTYSGRTPSYTPSTVGATLNYIAAFSELRTTFAYYIDLYVEFENTTTATVDIPLLNNFTASPVNQNSLYVSINYTAELRPSLSAPTAWMVGEATNGFYLNTSNVWVGGTQSTTNPVVNGANWVSPSLAIRTISSVAQPALRLTRYNSTSTHYTVYKIHVKIVT